MSIISLINKIPFGNSAEKGFFLYTKLPPSLFEKIEQDNFRKTVQYVAKYSKFYQRKFSQFKINISQVKSPQDLGDFFTTAEDIRENWEEFICAPPDTAYESTGTTSKKPKRVYFSRNEVEEAGWAGAVGLWGIGVRPEDRVVSSFDYSFWVSGPVLTASCKVLGCFHVEAGRISAQEFYDRLSDYHVNVIVGDPSWLLALTEVAEKKGAWPIKLMIGGGENMMEETRRYIESVWKADFILSYGQTEAFGAIGMESREKEGYHLNEFHNLFEIVNRDKDGYGELVYTTLNRRVMPLVRYKSGDITKFLEAYPPKSAADRNSRDANQIPGRRIAKLKGRVNEWTATGFGNVAPWMFEPVLESVTGLGEDWQIVIDKEGNKDLIELHVESVNGRNDQEIKENIFSSLKSQLPDSWNLYQMNLCKFDVKVSPKGSLRTGRKLLRLMDRRKF